ncbi:MAG: hypothetical protein UX09_C0041G0003 [Candidatus Uhrbacteria bacterium GW2011_GWE2_45_35]|uniref:PsbP C-terminal domain-containing protein n=1 Tax=Candidatus Uhrbacteria bacterium GW2011_GWE2_45_35 TaxID=1618993 RepID=A0A0G1QDS4_9BACT|nr:MAG: hypothetical protein UX09_C0041G0003 [Candidatus Uhrbacteria bacterium GW2011_GWE2_45_35]HBR80393.1 hypothetical protein [Candidatus Uhrbacteria bacterium]HCU32038.1 hypothetical protein [Candidatus Uhrbacteria bacterium]
MKTQAVWISVVIVGIAALIFVSRIMAPKPIDFPKESQKTTQETKIPEQNDPETEAEITAEALPEGWQKIETDNFTINAPKTWISSVPNATGDGTKKFLTVVKLESGVSDDAYTDPDVVILDISYLEKGEKTFDEIVKEFALNEDQAALQIEFMKESATPPYNEITTEDIVVTTEQVELKNGVEAKKITFQCLKVCYIEGPAYTIIQYFINDEDKIYKLEAKTATTEKTETLLLVAEQVVKTFEVK